MDTVPRSSMDAVDLRAIEQVTGSLAHWEMLSKVCLMLVLPSCGFAYFIN